MKQNLYTKSLIAFLALFLVSISSCKKLELDSERQPPITDAQAPSISNVTITNAAVFRGDSVDVSFTAKDDNGLYFLKIEYSPWKLLKSITLDGTMKEYTYTTRIAIPVNAIIQSHNLKLSAVDVAFKEAVSSASARVERKPGVYTEMFVYGDVILAGSLGKGWDFKYAEGMTAQPDGTLNLVVYNYKANGEFMLISSRSSTADILGGQTGGKVAKSSAVKIVIPAIGYHKITFSPDVMTYKVEPVTATGTISNLWIIGEGLAEFGGYDWDLGHAIPMASSPNNPNSFVKEVTRTTSAEGIIRVLTSLSWSGQIAWVSVFDVDNITDNTSFNLSKSANKFIYIAGHQGEKYTVKVDMFLNRGIAIKTP